MRIPLMNERFSFLGSVLSQFAFPGRSEEEGIQHILRRLSIPFHNLFSFLPFKLLFYL